MPPAWPMSSTVPSAKWRCLITRLNRSGPGFPDAGTPSGNTAVPVMAGWYWWPQTEPGRVVAFIDLEPDGHIDRLFCAPEAAGRGVASRL